MPLFTFDGDSAGDGFGSVSGAGDVNGDGTPDLIVGASRDNNNLENSGSVRVLSGIDDSILYDLAGDGGVVLEGFGTSVSGAGGSQWRWIDDFITGAGGGGANGGGFARVFVSQIAGQVLLGDVNQDGTVNFLDIAPSISLLSTNDFLVQADINGDGTVDFLDIRPFIALLSL